MSPKTIVILVDIGTAPCRVEVCAERLVPIMKRDVEYIALCFNAEWERRF